MQRTVQFTMPDGDAVQEEFSQTVEFCVHCGKQGAWANGDRSHRLCLGCGTVVCLGDQPRVPILPDPSDLWAIIAQQLEGEPSPAS